MRGAECREFLHQVGNRACNLKHQYQRVFGSGVPPLKRQHIKQLCRSSIELPGPDRRDSDLLISERGPERHRSRGVPVGTRELVGTTFLSHPTHKQWPLWEPGPHGHSSINWHRALPSPYFGGSVLPSSTRLSLGAAGSLPAKAGTNPANTTSPTHVF